MRTEEAYRRCMEITNQQAKNFSYGVRLLDPSRRAALSAIYALARRIDDIGDGAAAVPDKLEALEAVSRDIEELIHGGDGGEDPVLVAVADAASRLPIPLSAFNEVVEGCALDCRYQPYESFDQLVVYCRLVAGSIGRLSLGVFGARGQGADALADSLGVGLQLTNILRDLQEDRAMGRVYLPKDDLERFGLTADLRGPPDALRAVILLVGSRARGYYSQGFELLDRLDRRSRACVAAMSGIYWHLLGRIERRPELVMVERMSVPTWEKCWVAARSLAGARP